MDTSPQTDNSVLDTSMETPSVDTNTNEKQLAFAQKEIATTLSDLLYVVETEKLNTFEEVFYHGMLVSVAIAALFQSFALFDILGEAEGIENAYWIVFMMTIPLLVVLLWMQYQRSHRAKTTKAEKVDESKVSSPSPTMHGDVEMIIGAQVRNPLTEPVRVIE